jgi:sugar diacid utilization regulator
MAATTAADGDRMTIQGLLDESLMSGAHVVAGADRLDRALNWVLPLHEVPPVPEPVDALAVYARPQALRGSRAALSALADRGVTALVVDGALPSDFPRSGLPAAMVVIEMASPVGFAALNRLLAERSLTYELHVMRYSSHVHHSLAGLFRRGAGLEILIREVSNLARNPAMALDAHGHVVAHHGVAADAVEALSDSVARMLATGVPAGRRSSTHDSRVELVAGPRDSAWTCIGSAIRLGKALEGWVVVLVPVATVGDHDLARHRIVTDEATALIGSEMLLQHSVEEAEERARGDFIQALVHGSFTSEHDMRARAEHHEIDIDSPFGVFVAPGLLPHSVDNPAVGMVRLARYAASVCSEPSVRADATVIGDVVVVVRTLRGTDDAALQREMAAFAESMCRELEQRCETAVAVAYGRPAHSASEVAVSYREARVALDIARRLGYTRAISYPELRSYVVLGEITDNKRSRRLVREVIEPLQSSPNLFETLTGYLAHGGNINASARALNVHRNTILTRLDQISQMIGLDIREPETQFTVSLAVRLDLLAEASAAADREATFD